MRQVEASMTAVKETFGFQVHMREPGFLNNFCLLTFWFQTQVTAGKWNITTVGCGEIF